MCYSPCTQHAADLLLCILLTVCVCAEGMCANRLSKDIVPVMVEDSFQLTGWLDSLCIDEKCVKLYDPQKFDRKMLELVKELRTTIDGSEPG